MTLFPNTACEFPLLRARFWPESSSQVSSLTGSHSCRAKGDSSTRSHHLPWAAASGETEHSQHGVSPGLQSSSSACTSLGMGAIFVRHQLLGGSAGDPAPDPKRTASEALPRGRFGLRSLDLQALPRDDAGPPSELGARRQKFAQFEGQCSEVVPGLCVGGGAVARSRETLRAAGVTHVVNCVGMLIPPCFEPELQYLTLFMQDVPGEDLTSLLYTVFDFIEAARSGGGCVLVHCSQGVSRSAALVIGYLMWKLDQSYDEVYQAVKAIRGVANPNIGFTCQLLQWQKRRAASEPPQARVMRIAPASPGTPTILIAKPTALDGRGKGSSGLDPRGVFLLLRHHHCFVWQGKEATPELLQGGLAAAEALRRYEGVAAPVVVDQGEESPEALDTLRQAEGDCGEAWQNSEWDDDFQAMSKHSAAQTEHAGPQQQQARGKMPVPRMSLGSSTSLAAIAGAGDTPRGSKTPRSARRNGGSPNARARKSQRSQLQQPPSPGRPSRPANGAHSTSGSSGSSDDSRLGGTTETDSDSSDGDSKWAAQGRFAN